MMIVNDNCKGNYAFNLRKLTFKSYFREQKSCIFENVNPYQFEV